MGRALIGNPRKTSNDIRMILAPYAAEAGQGGEDRKTGQRDRKQKAGVDVALERRRRAKAKA
jgi:hypothetical protein